MKPNVLLKTEVIDDPVAQLVELLGNRVTMDSATAVELNARYKAAQPFPHVVIDNFFSNEILDPLLDEVATMNSRQWVQVGGDAGVQKVLRMKSVVEIGKAGQDLVNLVHSAPFLYLLSEITDVWQLLPDPYLQGSGNAVMRRGDFFKIHTDRSVAYETGLTRRLAMIVFLNKSWPADYGGELELWNHEGTECVEAIAPVFNRTVIFEVGDPNFHGVPAPLKCPDDRLRQSFLVYFHTVGASEASNRRPHTSIFAPGFYRKKKSRLENITALVAPPILIKASKKLYRLFKPRSAIRRA